MTLGERLSETAREHPRRVALIYEGRRYAYRELDALAEGLAAGLAGLGVSMGDRVALLLPNCPEFAVAYFGVVKAGATVVPLNIFLTAPELSYIINDSGCGVIISGPEFADRLGEVIKAAPGLKHVIVTGLPGPGQVAFESVIVKGGRGAGETDEESPAAVLYTSGTTGHPKGAVLTHKNLLSNAASCAVMFRVTKRDRFLLFLPMFHAFSCLVCMILPLTVGASALILHSVKPFSKVIKAVVFGRATFFVAIPAVYNILSTKRFPKLLIKLLPLRLCVSGAAPLPGDTLARFASNFPVPLLEGYGLTETSPVVSCNPIFGQRKEGSVGLPVPGVEVRVVDDEGRELPAGSVGELTVRGPNVMKGYLNNKQATREAIRDGWLYTGDMGKKDEEGYIFIVDRKKDLVLVHGMNVYPREVEEVLYQHPAIAEAAVVGTPDPHGGEALRAFISLKEGVSLTEREVKDYLKPRLASYKLPRHVQFMSSLPVSRTGKVLKRELRNL